MKGMAFYDQYIAGLRSVLHLLEAALEKRRPVPGCDNLLRLRLLFEDATVSFDHVMRCMQAHAQSGGPRIEEVFGAASKLLNIAGALGTALQLYKVGEDAATAYQQGDHDRAAKLVTTGLAEMAVGLGTGVALGELAAPFIAALLPTGPVGWAVSALTSLALAPCRLAPVPSLAA